jgi:two-component system, chemotaxis family, chemotaxis protein CheY
MSSVVPESTRFLLVDDMVSVRDLVTCVLRERKFKNFVEAANGKEALERLSETRSSGATVEFVLCDIQMPEMNGIEFVKAARLMPEFADLPIVMVSAVGDSATVIEAISAGATSYVLKPFSPEDLISRIELAWQRVREDKEDPSGKQSKAA